MKGILLSLISCCFLVLVSIPAVRFYSGKKYFKPLLGVFFLSAGFYAILFFFFPPDLGFLSSDWIVASSKLDFANGLLILFLLFHSFWDTLYTSFFTGFSTGILIRFWQHFPRGLSVDDCIRMFQKNSANPVIECRLENLVQGNYLALLDSQKYSLLAKGNFFAVITRAFQRLLHMGEGG